MKKAALSVLLTLLVLAGCSSNDEQSLAKRSEAQKPVPVYQFPQYDGKTTPRYWEIFLDTSGSMEGGKLAEAKRAIEEFLTTAPGELAIGLAVFRGDGTIIQVVPIAHDNRQSIMNRLPVLRAGGGTPLTEAVQFCSEQLAQQMEQSYGYGEFNLLVVTDGEADDKKTLAQAVQVMQERNVYGAPMLLSTIGFQLNEEHSLKQGSLKYLEANDSAGLLSAMQEATRSEIQDLKTLLGF